MKAISILAVPPIVVGLFVCLFILSSSYGLPAVGHGETPSEPLLSQVIERERIANKLPKGLIEGLIHWETARTWDETAKNPERNSKCYRTAAEDDREKCASYGIMQVVSFWHGKVPERGEDQVVQGARILGKCMRRTRTVVGALGCFNGDRSGKYAANVIREARLFGYRG